MRGRPRKPEPSPIVQADIERLAARGIGREAIAKRLGVTTHVVRTVRSLLGLSERRANPWTDPQRLYLREHVGEQTPSRLAREVSAIGPEHTEGAVRAELSRMGLSAESLRTDLTVSQVGELVGRSEGYVLAAIQRRELRARMAQGAWRVWPSEVVAWIDADPNRINWQRAKGSAHELWTLARGLWGKGDG